MTGDFQDVTGKPTGSKAPVLGDHAETDAFWVGGRGAESPAAGTEKMITVPGGRDLRQRDRRVMARSVPRRAIDEGLIVQALLMIAKDLEQRDVSGEGAVSEG